MGERTLPTTYLALQPSWCREMQGSLIRPSLDFRTLSSMAFEPSATNWLGGKECQFAATDKAIMHLPGAIPHLLDLPASC